MLARLEQRLNALRRQEQRKRKRKSPPQPLRREPGLKAAMGAVKGHGRTRLDRARLATLWRAASNVAHVPGMLAEVGTYRGGSAYFIAATFRAMLGHELPFVVIDTFEGHPRTKLSQQDEGQQAKPDMFASTSFEDVVQYLSRFQQITVRQGEFSQLAPTLPEQPYRFVHLDVDLYESTRGCIAYFAQRLSPGGVIVLDDYGKPSCPGVAPAVKEFLADSPGFQLWEFAKQAVLVKIS
jgi:hypothetical protein